MTPSEPRRPPPHARPVRGRVRSTALATLAATLALGGTGARTEARPAPAATPPSTPAAPSGDSFHLAVTTYKLKNGLTLLVHEDHSAPIVTVNLWYHVGSKDERPGRTGFAHLFEHLMFQGSEHVADDEHLRLIAEAGGSANASTAEDRTNFFETVPSNFLERVLFLESDRMGWFASALDQKKLDTQRDVVLNERRQSHENRPYGMAPFAVHEAIYPADHPYHWLTIGSPSDLLAANLDDVRTFFRTWYTPDNASIVIAGDVTVAEAKRLTEKYFGAIPVDADRPRGERATPGPVSLAKDKKDTLRDRVSLERIELTWPSPAWFQPGDAELDLLATLLGGKSGRLYKRLVYDLKIAQSVQVGQSSARLGSLFQISATARPGHTAAELQKVIDEELAKLLGPSPVTEDELSRARNRWEANFVFGLEALETRADLLNQYFDALGDADGLDKDRRRYVDATPEAVNRAAMTVLKAHRHELTIVPEKSAAPAAASTAQPPKQGQKQETK